MLCGLLELSDFMLKQFFSEVFGFDKEIKLLKEKNSFALKREKNLIKVLGDFEEKFNSCEIKYKVLLKVYNDLRKEFEDFSVPVDVPSAEITYMRPVLIAKNEYNSVAIDVRNFIMPDFEMEKKLKAKNLIYNGSQNLDELIPLVYRFAKTGYKYGCDSKYGFDEYWMFPFELQTVLKHQKAGDCDDWANLIGSYFAAAKIPCDRWLVSAGMTRSGFGHATFYAKDSTNVWRHLNSTSPSYNRKLLSDYPSSKDENDFVGIKPNGFWFSYNFLFAIHRWDSEEAKKSFEAAKLLVKIKRDSSE